MGLNDLLDPFIDLFYPKNCRYCGESFREGVSNILCGRCWGSIRGYEGDLCPGCGVTVPSADPDDRSPLCSECDGVERSRDRTWSLGPYEGPLRIVHHGFKFEGLQGLAGMMAARITARIPKPIDGCLVPIPVFPAKGRERGYNPAFDLAMGISSIWRLPVRKLLKKTRNTPAQMSLSQKERAKNTQGAFATLLCEKVPSKVVLVDDVLTTGATLDECARVLKRAGVDRVDAIVWGRTPKNFSL